MNSPASPGDTSPIPTPDRIPPDSPSDSNILSHLRHDLRTPINHILGYAELLQEELADEGKDGFTGDLEKIRQAAGSLLTLINHHITPEGLSALQREELSEAVGKGLEKCVPVASVAPPRPAPDEEEAPSPITGHILIVDDNAENRETLRRRLERQGHTTEEAENGRIALKRLEEQPFDLVLLDMIMPEVDGYAVLKTMKASATLREIPVIMISALDGLESVVTCIEKGAEDYLSKPFQPTLLRARIGATLEKKALRDQEREYLQTIERTQQRLARELDEAGNYVRSILPAPMAEPFRIDWRFVPSTELGGDSFGYHWLDDEHFAIYLLDVCGHGVGAALLSVAVINVLRSGSLGADFRDPASVLRLLNDTFPMEQHNNMYFTIWYGVYHRPSGTLRHSSGGHPAAFLLPPGGAPLQQLRCPGLVVGVMPGVDYQSEITPIPPGSRLFVLSDGTYEIRTDGGMLEYDHFVSFFQEHGSSPTALDDLERWIFECNGGPSLDDDFSIVSLDF